ncbi:MAG: T9SS type A sorting domain-containing protein [Bacteroidales bacterium]|nr:T9SS type A sorting domain-containing protein [Bacteroidales bacterium]
MIATGSSFINSYSSDPSGTGIYATGAGITVGAWCSVTSISPCPEQDLVHCTFSNLRIGIYAINTPGSHSVNVSRSDFYAVQKGIYLSAYSSSTLVLNTINIPEPAGGIQSYPGPYGMYLDNCTLYHIEGNTFQSTVAVPTTIGLVVNNSGTDANVIYRNTFLDLKYNTVAQDVNRNSSSTTGLCYVCNSFKTPLATPSYNTVAIVVTHTGNYSPSYGIARYQNAVFGGITVPAFNRFYNASVPAIPQYYDIFNNCYSIDSYLYPLIYNLNNGYTFRPLNHSANVTLIQSSISFSNQCPDLIDYGGTQSKDSLILNGGSEGKWNINGLDSLVDILISRNTIDSYYDLAFLYLQNRKIEMAQDILLKIPSQFSFTSDDQKNYEAFISLFNIIKVRMTSSVNQLDLDEQQTIALIQISEKCHNRLGSYARNMLIASKKINYIEPIILPAFDRTMMNQEQDDNGTQVINGCLKAHPNPANKYIIVDYDLSSKSYSKAGIKVFSSVGKLLVDEHLIMNKTQITINTEEWSSGLYLLKLELDGNVIETTKISIIK